MVLFNLLLSSLQLEGEPGSGQWQSVIQAGESHG